MVDIKRSGGKEKYVSSPPQQSTWHGKDGQLSGGDENVI